MISTALRKQNRKVRCSGRERSGTYTEIENHVYDPAGNIDSKNATIGYDNRLLDDPNYEYVYDREGRLIRQNVATGNPSYFGNVYYTYDLRGNLIEAQYHSFSGIELTVTYTYDALNRRIARTIENTLDTSQSSELAYILDGTRIITELDVSGAEAEIARMHVYGPSGDRLATDTAASGISCVPTATVWAFTDLNGSVTSTAFVDGAGDFDLSHRRFTSFGEVAETYPDTSLPAEKLALFEESDIIWKGRIVDDVYRGSGNGASDATTVLHLIDGRFYNPTIQRFFTPGTVSLEQPNPYLLGGNDPLNRGPQVDWTTIEGPGPFTSYGSAVFGLIDTGSFGIFYDNDVRSQAAENGTYYIGVAGAIVGQLAATILTAGTSTVLAGSVGGAALSGGARIALATGIATARNLGVARSVTAVGVTGYNITGDILALANSSTAIANGTFTATDTLGFVPTLGYVGQLRRLQRDFRLVRNATDEATRLIANASNRQQRQLIATSQARIGDAVSPVVTNIYQNPNRFGGLRVNGGVLEVIDETEFITSLRRAYAEVGETLHPVIERRIRSVIQDTGGVFNIRNGILGLHAEVRAANDVLNQLAVGGAPTLTTLQQIRIATVRVKRDGNFFQRGVFPACTNCGSILEESQIITGRVR